MLNTIASWLENPDNEILLLAEDDDDSLVVTVQACVQAAAILKKAAEDVEQIEPQEEGNITPENLDKIAAIADMFDKSGDSELQKQASVLDELLLTISSPENAYKKKLAEADRRLEALKDKYEGNKKIEDEQYQVEDIRKELDKSGLLQNRVQDTSLSTRYCPDHVGESLGRQGDVWQCALDKKAYDFNEGYTKMDGMKVPGGDVANQTKFNQDYGDSMFDSRDSRLRKP